MLRAEMHIALVVSGLGAGGAERVIAQLSNAWAGAAHRITIISFDDDALPAYHDFGRQVDLLRLAVRGRGAWPRRVAALRRTLRRLAPDIVISFLTKINVVTLLATIGLGIPVIVSERNNPRRQAASRWWIVLLNRLYPRASGIVLQTDASRECLPAAVAARAVVIANPVARPVHRPATPRHSPTLAAVGRLEPQKGFDLLLPAFATACADHPGWQLAIWGDGPGRTMLLEQAAALGIAGRVRLCGLSVTPLGWTADADAFVLSSRYEGFPNALAEAMAAGLAVAAFDCSYGPAEMIRTEINGLLVPDGDTAALAAALSRLMGSQALRASLGAAARCSMARCDPGAIVDQWDRLLASVTRSAA